MHTLDQAARRDGDGVSDILVLDDDPFMLKLLGRMLAVQGYVRILPFQKARLALASLDDARQMPPALVLCDLNMPDMDGVEFVRSLVQRGYLGALILVSGETPRVLEAADCLARAHGIAVLGHLQKPVSSTTLASLLRAWRAPPPATRRAAAQRSRDELGHAIRNGELVNYYQPKVQVSTGRVTGVETLVRWLHPDDGLLGPDAFITLAEETGMIDDLTHVVARTALRQCAAWQAARLGLDVAINVSTASLLSVDLPDLLGRAADHARLDSGHVIIEITESRVVADLRAPLDVLTRLRLKGFRLSIDDFGTGHSSLVQLRDFPFNEMKLDRSFVHHAGRHPTVAAIYGASVSLGRQLGIDVVVEGVEDREDWDFVRASGCSHAQGYFIGRPMPAEALEAWMADWSARCESEIRGSAVALA